ncbi:hybrid sensor histidine kinase/response regulator [Actinophytocola sp.]|uniref:ATP-binding response regulator n=1 Tax=Actinophytocola sp. TaxID=1872138 RepID=UPI002D554EBC|nr:hybrid sensor histidine kinase/response regulator [Actinophytocola sp.]HYQ69234.1 hybrid sensor histidine kinase/response regulator [Actinophytocola sp.]
MTPSHLPSDVLRMTSATERDVFTVRQRGREFAEAIGLDRQDQLRLAAALSDIGRDLVRQGVTAVVTFAIDTEPATSLRAEFSWQGEPAERVLPNGFPTASRLLDAAEPVHANGRGGLVLRKLRPATLPPLSDSDIAGLRARLTESRAADPLDELRAQNQELLDTLENVEFQRKELLRLNEELEETNRGVMALYKELSDELDETNRGVVALYAELNEKSTQLKAVNEAKTRFWSTISHELRSPINSVRGLAQLLSAPGSEPLTDEQRRQVQLIEDSGTTLLALVNELLDTAKAESGRLVPQLVPVNLVDVFGHLRGTMRSTIRSADVALVIDDPSSLPPLWTDETMLVRILRNLLSNSLKFTECGEVRLRAELAGDGGHVRFTVTDTGIGIPDDQIERVFEEFHQVRSPLQTRAGGTGLGLPYARRLAVILGGGLVLESQAGEGTTATLRLPVRDPEDRGLPDLGTLLVVDDDESFRDRIGSLLGEFSDAVSYAADGRAALDAVAEHRPGMVFLDLYMPGMNGREVLGVLREKAELRTLPVVVVTSSVPDGLDLSSAGLGAALLPKSQLSVETLRHAITEALMVLPRSERQ